eukprot:361445-Chlamydomonas_euryale.AAC.4
MALRASPRGFSQMPKQRLFRIPKLPPHHAQCFIIPYYALLAIFGVVSSAVGPDLLRFGRIILRCCFIVTLQFVRHFILLEVGSCWFFRNISLATRLELALRR